MLGAHGEHDHVRAGDEIGRRGGGFAARGGGRFGGALGRDVEEGEARAIGEPGPTPALGQSPGDVAGADEPDVQRRASQN